MKPGWVRIDGEKLSDFHKQLIAQFPHYRTMAVTECALPSTVDVLAYEEREAMKPWFAAKKKREEDLIVESIFGTPAEQEARAKRWTDSAKMLADKRAIANMEFATTARLVQERLLAAAERVGQKRKVESVNTLADYLQRSRDAIGRAYVESKRKAVEEQIVTFDPPPPSDFTVVTRNLYGSYKGKAGHQGTLLIQPARLFRGTSTVWTPTCSVQVLEVGIADSTGRILRDMGRVPAGKFADEALAELRNYQWSTCQQHLWVAIKLSFVHDFHFDVLVTGKTTLVEGACVYCVNAVCECPKKPLEIIERAQKPLLERK